MEKTSSFQFISNRISTANLSLLSEMHGIEKIVTELIFWVHRKISGLHLIFPIIFLNEMGF